MTKRASGLIITTAALYFFALETNVGWLYIIVALLSGAILASISYPLLALKGLSLKRQLMISGRGAASNEDLYEGDGLEIAITIERSTKSPTHFLSLSEWCPLDAPGKESKRFFLTSTDGPQTRISYAVSCYKRGHYSFPPVLIESRGPAGLFRRRRRVAADTSVTVYPKYYELPADSHGSRRIEHDSTRPQAGYGGEFYGTREYRTGDSPRHIHWRSTARVGELVIKEFEERARPELGIALDTSANFGEGRESAIEYSVKLAATIARRATLSGYRVRVLAEGAPVKEMSWREVLEFLARLEPNQRLSAKQLLATPFTPPFLITLTPWTGPDSLVPMISRPGAPGRRAAIVLAGFPGQPPLQTEHLGGHYIPCLKEDSIPEAAWSALQQLEGGATGARALSTFLVL